MASQNETPSWNGRGQCGCKGCGVARKQVTDHYEVIIQRVRDLHRPQTWSKEVVCFACSDCHAEPYPCRTIRALDGTLVGDWG